MSQEDGNQSRSEAAAKLVNMRSGRLQVEQACIEWESDLKAFLLGVLRDRHTAEDAFQKTVVRAIESADSSRQETLRGWLFRIALNEARQIRRENRRSAVHLGQLAEHRAAEGSQSIKAADASLFVDVGLLNEDVVESIRQSLLRLPEPQREVIRRRIYDGLTFAEIAREMEQPLGTVLTWMRRGLQRLKEDSALRTIVDGGDETGG